MQNKQLGVCIVGCGAMGTVHAGCWDTLAEANIVAVVDIIEERARKMAEDYGLDTHYADYREAVQLPEVDVVSVCVPTCSHAEISVYAAEQGKHVLSEKPMALTQAGAESMLAAAERNQVKLGVGFMRRHTPILPALRNWLASGQLGRPVLYQALDYRQIRPKREMHDAHANGGPVIDMGVHLYDVWAYIFDSEPVEVYAQGFTFGEGRQELAHIAELACDTASVTVRYASGDVGVFTVSWGLPPGVVPEGVPDQILGPRGMIHVKYGRTHQLARVLHELDEKPEGEPPWEPLAESKQDMYQLEIANFAYSILNDLPPVAGGKEGKTALKVALAALESIRTGNVIQIKE